MKKHGKDIFWDFFAPRVDTKIEPQKCKNLKIEKMELRSF